MYICAERYRSRLWDFICGAIIFLAKSREFAGLRRKVIRQPSPSPSGGNGSASHRPDGRMKTNGKNEDKVMPYYFF